MKTGAVVVRVMLTAPAAAEPPPEFHRMLEAHGGAIEIKLASGRRLPLSGQVDV